MDKSPEEEKDPHSTLKTHFQDKVPTPSEEDMAHSAAQLKGINKHSSEHTSLTGTASGERFKFESWRERDKSYARMLEWGKRHETVEVNPGNKEVPDGEDVKAALRAWRKRVKEEEA